MSVIARERPGVYSDYETSGILYSKSTGKNIAIIAKSIKDINYTCTTSRLSDIKSIFGTDGLMYSMCKSAFENGANTIVAVSAGSSDDNYQSVFNNVATLNDISIVVCDSTSSSIQNLLIQSVKSASENKKERITILAAPDSISSIKTWANNINYERAILIAQKPIDSDGTTFSGSILASAFAGIISQYTDPSQSFNGVDIEGFSSLNISLSETDVDYYITSGVTPFEIVAGKIEIIRAVTSKTLTDGVEDKTFKELNVILIIDTVIASIRDSLKSYISKSKNNTSTRNAISSQVTVKLEEFLDANIINSYVSPNVYQSSDDASVCIVEISFIIAQGINQIHIIANINI